MGWDLQANTVLMEGEANMTKGSRPELRALLRERQKGLCAYCGIKMRVSFPARMRHDSETLEHLNRRADGGGNERDNLVLSCYQCNTGRGDADWLSWKTMKTGEIFDI